MQPGLNKHIVISLGITTIMLLAILCVVCRDKIAIAFHLYQLGEVPSHLLDIVAMPEGTPARSAIHKFLNTDNGRKMFIVSFITVAINRTSIDSPYTELLKLMKGDKVLLGVGRLFQNQPGFNASWCSVTQHGKKLLHGPFEDDSHLLSSFAELLPEVANRNDVVSYRGIDLSCSILKIDVAAESYNSSGMNNSVVYKKRFDSGPYVGLFEVVESMRVSVGK